MPETQLSVRQIKAVVLVFVIFFGGMMAYAFAAFPSYADPVGSRRAALVCGIIAALATIWFIKLMVDAVRDRKRGTEHAAAQIGGRFNIVFGALVAAGGITCSALTYFAAVASGDGIWTLYYGMILWGLGQMIIGFRQLRDERRAAADDLAPTRSMIPEFDTISEEE